MNCRDAQPALRSFERKSVRSVGVLRRADKHTVLNSLALANAKPVPNATVVLLAEGARTSALLCKISSEKQLCRYLLALPHVTFAILSHLSSLGPLTRPVLLLVIRVITSK